MKKFTMWLLSAVFVVVLLTLIPIIFPALFSSFFGMFTENLDPFELGYQSVFFIVSNVVILIGTGLNRSVISSARTG